MPAARTPLLLLVLILLCCGCATPWTTRLPTLAFGSPRAEKRAYERHDPFPVEELGPDTQTRPRGFIEPRTEERKAMESQINNLQPESASPFPNVPMTGSTYPDVVSP
jgi:hypothetical protein